jgi:hypothetical protein
MKIEQAKPDLELVLKKFRLKLFVDQWAWFGWWMGMYMSEDLVQSNKDWSKHGMRILDG